VTAFELHTTIFHDEQKTKEWTVAAVVEAIGPGGVLPESIRSEVSDTGQLPGRVLRSEVAAGIISSRQKTLRYVRDPFEGNTIPDPGFTPDRTPRNLGQSPSDASDRVIPTDPGDAIRGSTGVNSIAGDVLGDGPGRDLITMANANFGAIDLFTRINVNGNDPLLPKNNGRAQVIEVLSPTQVRVDKVFTVTAGPTFTINLPQVMTLPQANFTEADNGRQLQTLIAANPLNTGTEMIVKVLSPTAVQLGQLAAPNFDTITFDEGTGFGPNSVHGAAADDTQEQIIVRSKQPAGFKRQRKPKADHRKKSYFYRVEKSIGRFDKIMQTNQSDAQLLTKLAKALGYVWYVQSFAKPWFNGDEIPEVHFRFRDFGQEPSYEFDMDSEILVDEPQIDFNILDIPDQSFSRGLNPVTQKLFEARQAIDDTRRIMNASATPLRDIEALYPTTATDDKKAAEEADGLYKKTEEHLLKMSLLMVGDPHVVAKRTCVLRNFFEPFSNMPLYIRSIKYILKPGSVFTMEMKLMAKAINFNTPSEAMYEIRRLERIKRSLISKYAEARNIARKAKQEENKMKVHIKGVPFYTGARVEYDPLAGTSTAQYNRESPPVSNDQLDPKVVRAEWQKLIDAAGLGG
jgi:hypothetical protein